MPLAASAPPHFISGAANDRHMQSMPAYWPSALYILGSIFHFSMSPLEE